MIGVEPDLTILIDMDPNEGLSRALAQPTKDLRFENFGADLQHAMRAGFLTLAEEFKDRFSVINGARAIEAVTTDVVATVEKRLLQ